MSIPTARRASASPAWYSINDERQTLPGVHLLGLLPRCLTPRLSQRRRARLRPVLRRCLRPAPRRADRTNRLRGGAEALRARSGAWHLRHGPLSSAVLYLG